jgi:hypothetical protein
MLIALLHTIARGGGGGSGGGGGGGGSGGGGILFVIGYLPTHFVGAALARKTPRYVAYPVTTVLTVTYAILLGIIFSHSVYHYLLPPLALLGGPAGLFGWFDALAKRTKQAKVIVQRAALVDPTWDEAFLKQYVTDTFYKYQADWSSFKFASIQTYTTPAYFYHNQLMLTALKNLKRQNRVENPKLLSLTIVEALDATDNSQDHFVVQIVAKANDILWDDNTQSQIYKDTSTFTEFWHFYRNGKTWLLSSISQATEDVTTGDPVAASLAAANGFCYSPDWGWLLLPLRGQLFAMANFKNSDINNHVIGVYHSILVQLYSYVPRKASGGKSGRRYVIAQATLPKTYGNIIVRKHQKFSLFGSKPRGLDQISLEWPDFNRRYEVFASSSEAVSAFELLHPVFMERLFALPFAVNIEVVDVNVYLYSDDAKADYGTMLDILKNAFNEMKL